MKSRAIIKRTYALIVLLLTTVIIFNASGQDPVASDTSKNQQGTIYGPGGKRSFRITSLTFGGNGVNLTQVNGQFSIMTGGRGSATFNKRFTLGGGGWGMTRGITMESTAEGVYNFIKMGYGGVDFGYLLYPGEKFNLGIKLLIAGGAVFKETVPESEDSEFQMFPALEPTLYYQVSLSRIFRFEMGISYRYIRGVNLPYITDRELSGLSCYFGFLVSTGDGSK